ncbi:HAD family hydrolase [Candidatus Halobonum tyrrellensis]|uniref:Cobalamine operon protein, hydrolase n=1 Tax=Candidatus Halobonum tyrrellensis G22 TaxID=1324957 RepID=V4GSS4_9EURY|nr:HAD family hydrolase [Candidatus Halobonum tyrrellensis]ESP88146.1 cobalamine operon protein, hydrolase [Candidatus Halobonum tyrrellensis G22]
MSPTATSFDLFGTLVDVPRPADTAAAVGRELRERGVAVPDDWAEAYREPHVDAPAGAEVPLPAHVTAALASRGVDAPGNAARRAVVAAFDPEVTTREGAPEAVRAAADRGPVGLLSNCAVPELVGRTLVRSGLARDDFDAVVSSVACGWCKPDARAFEALAGRLDAPVGSLTHVGDTPEADGGVADAGGTFVDVGTTPLPTLAARWAVDP